MLHNPHRNAVLPRQAVWSFFRYLLWSPSAHVASSRSRPFSGTSSHPTTASETLATRFIWSLTLPLEKENTRCLQSTLSAAVVGWARSHPPHTHFSFSGHLLLAALAGLLLLWCTEKHRSGDSKFKGLCVPWLQSRGFRASPRSGNHPCSALCSQGVRWSSY